MRRRVGPLPDIPMILARWPGARSLSFAAMEKPPIANENRYQLGYPLPPFMSSERDVNFHSKSGWTGNVRGLPGGAFDLVVCHPEQGTDHPARPVDAGPFQRDSICHLTEARLPGYARGNGLPLTGAGVWPISLAGDRRLTRDLC